MVSFYKQDPLNYFRLPEDERYTELKLDEEESGMKTLTGDAIPMRKRTGQTSNLFEPFRFEKQWLRYEPLMIIDDDLYND
jgi:hypothetical protein